MLARRAMASRSEPNPGSAAPRRACVSDHGLPGIGAGEPAAGLGRPSRHGHMRLPPPPCALGRTAPRHATVPACLRGGWFADRFGSGIGRSPVGRVAGVVPPRCLTYSAQLPTVSRGASGLVMLSGDLPARASPLVRSLGQPDGTRTCRRIETNPIGHGRATREMGPHVWFGSAGRWRSGLPQPAERPGSARCHAGRGRTTTHTELHP